MQTAQIQAAIVREGLAGTAQEIRDALSADVQIENRTAYTWSGLNRALAAAGVELPVIAGAVSAVQSWPGGDSLHCMLLSGGVEFSDPAIRYMLGAAAVASPQDTALIDAMLAIGVQAFHRYERAGLPSLPSVDDVAAALERISTRQWLSHLINEILLPAEQAGATVADLRALVEGA